MFKQDTMFVGRLLAIVLLPYMGVVVPMDRIFAARTNGDHTRMMRWASYMICTLVGVVPIAWWIPTWVVGRYDLICILLYMLSISDAAVAEMIVTRYLNPYIAQMRMVSLLTTVAFRPPDAHASSDSSSDSSDDESYDDEDKKED